MKTYTTKTANNGATLYYSTESGKKISRTTALENERKYILANGTTKERYALAQEDFYLTSSGEIMKNGFYTAISRGTSKAFKLTTKCDWHIISNTCADIDLKRFYNLTVDEFRAEAEAERVIDEAMAEGYTTPEALDAAIEGEKAAANAENPFAMTATEVLEDRRAEQVAKDDEKTYTYTTNRGNVYTAYYGETGSIPRSRWYYYHEVGGLSEQVIIEFSKEDGGEFVNMLCKFIATETDGSEDDADEPNVFNLLPALDSLRDVEEADETYTAQTSWENPHEYEIVGDLDTDRYLAVRYHFTNDVETEEVINNAGLDTEVFSLLPTLEETDEDDDTDEPEILNADKWVNLYSSPDHEKADGIFVKIGGNRLSFSGHELYSITDERHGFELKFNNGKKLFYSTRFDAAVMRVLPQITSAKKVIETYMNRELAAEQEKNFRNFFLADVRKNSTGFYNVVTTVTFADDVDHNYGVNFDKFSNAQAFVEEVKNFVGNVPACITIRSHQNIYYHRTQDGSETYNVDPEQLNLIDEYAVSKSAFDIAVEAEEKAAAANVEVSTKETPPTTPAAVAVSPILKCEVDVIKNLGEGTFTFSHAEESDGTLTLYFDFTPSCFIITGKEATLAEVYTDGKLTRLEEIIGDSRWTREVVNGEEVTYYNGAFNFAWSDKYSAGYSTLKQTHLLVKVPDGQWYSFKNFAVGDDEFFQIMSERGACTISETEPPETPETNLTESESPATFKVGEVYRADWRKADDGLATFRILGRSIMFVTAVPVAFAECDAFDEDKDYVFKAKIRSNERGEFFNYDDMTVSAGEAYKLDEPEPVEPPVESFTAKRDRLLAERDAANAKLKVAEEALKAAKLNAYNASEAVYNFMVDNMSRLNEKLFPLPDAEIELKTADGHLTYIYPETIRIDFADLKFLIRGDCSELNGVTLGTYDTPAQVEDVIAKLSAAIERGDKRFDFTNPGQNFDKRAMRDSLERAMKFALERHEGFVKLGQLSAAEHELKLYAICRNALAALK
ncbi:MAG: hypothetical protein IJG24_01750 [Selenomonadaceae bacterium]|nr:hypothetical protein [Selenomonadaceae bacterium]